MESYSKSTSSGVSVNDESILVHSTSQISISDDANEVPPPTDGGLFSQLFESSLPGLMKVYENSSSDESTTTTLVTRSTNTGPATSAFPTEETSQPLSSALSYRHSTTCEMSAPHDGDANMNSYTLGQGRKRKPPSMPLLLRSADVHEVEMTEVRPSQRARTSESALQAHRQRIAHWDGLPAMFHEYRSQRKKSSTIDCATEHRNFPSVSHSDSEDHATADVAPSTRLNVPSGSPQRQIRPPSPPPPHFLDHNKLSNREHKTKTGAKHRGDAELKTLRAKAYRVRSKGIIKPNLLAKGIISAICHASPYDSLAVASGLRSINHHLQGTSSAKCEKNGIGELLAKVEHSTENLAVTSFQYLLTHLLMHLKIQSELKSDSTVTISRIYSAAIVSGEIAMPRFAFNEILNLGAKVAALLCAGTMHLLPLIACIPNFQFVLATTDVASLWTACELIRTPESDPSGHTEKLIKERLIPSLLFIASNCLFKIDIFGLTSVNGLPISTLESHSVRQSDHILQSVCRNVLILPSSCEPSNLTQGTRPRLWEPLIEHDDGASYELSSSQPFNVISNDIPARESVDDSTSIIKGEFYPGSAAWRELFSRLTPFSDYGNGSVDPINLNIADIKLPRELGSILTSKSPINDKNRLAWTEAHVKRCQRDIASGEFTAKCLTDLRLLLQSTPSSPGLEGLHTDIQIAVQLPYVFIPRSLLQLKKSLKFVTMDKKMVAGVVTEMPMRFRNVFTELVGMAGNQNVFMTVSRGSPGENFKTAHFQINLAYTPDPAHFPKVHPSRIEPLHTKNGRKTINYRQLCIHASNETLLNQRFYSLLETNLEAAIVWLCEAYRKIAPDEYKSSESYVKSLPLGVTPIHYPFSGLVFNVSSQTLAHRDKRDGGFCMVVPFGDWKGGELVLHELRLIIDLNHCDAILFRSSELTHFNLSFEGSRNALVFHCDSQLLKWEDHKKKLGNLVST